MPLERPQPRRTRSTRLSLFGDGLPERLRSTSFALLGVTVAAALGLVGFVLHQGWPVAPDLPIPGSSPRHEAVHAAAVVVEADPESADRERRAEGGSRPSAAEPANTARVRSRLAAADRVAAWPARKPGQSQPNPVTPDGEQPKPAAPAPVEAPPSAGEAPSAAPPASTPPTATSFDGGDPDEAEDGSDHGPPDDAKPGAGDSEAEHDDDWGHRRGRGGGRRSR